MSLKLPFNYIFVIAFLFVLAFLPARAFAVSEVKLPEVAIVNSVLSVSTSLALDPEHIDKLKKGLSKEIVFDIDLFRTWDRWPNEFIQGKTISQSLICDPVKKEYVLVSKRGKNETTKRFQSCDYLIAWSMTLPGEVILNITELEPATYYIKVTAASRIRKLPPFINLLFFFVEEEEFSISVESTKFTIGAQDE